MVYKDENGMTPEEWSKFIDKLWIKEPIGCLFDKLSPEDRNKPMGISCPCRKCTPWSLGC